MREPTHCTNCGRLLVERRSEDPKRDAHTGAKTYHTERVCSRLIGPFGWLLGTYHSKFTLYEGRGNTRPSWSEAQWL